VGAYFLKSIIRLVLFCGIAFAATVLLLRISDRGVHEPPPTLDRVPSTTPAGRQASTPVSPTVRQDEIVGRATVVDGDTIEVQRQRIRLDGIDAPESQQTCLGADSKLYFCGSKAALALADFLRDATVRCKAVGYDQYRRIVARCSARGEDLASVLVRSGWALDWPRYSGGEYGLDQKAAQAARRGMWAGKFVEPWNWRMCMRNGGQRNRCSTPT
jgi:endonuclease YncB( thermonuclease family)